MKHPTSLNGRKPLWLVWITLWLFGLAGCANAPLATFKPFNSFVNVEPQGSSAEWRAINRLSYGPSVELLANIKSADHPKDWALQQLDAARNASQQPPQLPADLASINDNLPTIFDGARKEREARAAVPAGTRINELVANEKRFNFKNKLSLCITTARKSTKRLHGDWQVAAMMRLSNLCWLA